MRWPSLSPHLVASSAGARGHQEKCTAVRHVPDCQGSGNRVAFSQENWHWNGNGEMASYTNNGAVGETHNFNGPP